MKIYFTASRAGKDTLQDEYEQAVKILKESNNEVIERIVSMSKEQMKAHTEDELIKLYHELLEDIKKADAVVAEISVASTNVAHEISIALNERKPVLAIYKRGAFDEHSVLLQGNPSKLLSVSEYKDNSDLNKIISEFLKTARNKIDTKFILIISPEIDRYLEWAADYKRMHKAQIVRNAVEKEIKNDKDYQKYTKTRAK